MSTGVLDLQPVDAETTNAAFLGKNGDDVAIGRIGFASTDPASGATIANIQRELSAIRSAIGMAANQAFDFILPWTLNIVGASTDAAKARIEALVGKFAAGAGGHTHTGVDGDGPWVKGAGLLLYASSSDFVTAKGSAVAEGDAYYDTTLHQAMTYNGSAWVSTGVPSIFGGRASPCSVVAATGITSGAGFMSTTALIQDVYVEGASAGDNAVSAIPQIEAGTIDGQVMTLIGRNDSQTLTLADGDGLSLNGPCTLAEDSILRLRWDGANWVEMSRNML